MSSFGLPQSPSVPSSSADPDERLCSPPPLDIRDSTSEPSLSTPNTPRPASSHLSTDAASDSLPPPLPQAPPPQTSTTMSRLGRIQYESSPLSGRPSLPGSSQSAPAGTLSLLSSADLYISPPPSSFLGNGTTLQDLAKLVKHEAYRRHKRAQCRIRLHRSLISTALHARLIKVCKLSHALLVEQLKGDQKQEFARLYNAIIDVRNSAEMYRRYASLEQDYDPAKEKEAKEDDDKPRELVSFLHDTPLQARDTILSFLSRLRSSPTFLANRLSKLSQQELDSLAKIHNPIDSSDSVIPNRASARGSSSQARTPPQSTVENILTFRRNDALHIMIHSLFANPDGPDSQEEKMRIDVWSTACARLLTDGTKKTDQFLFAVLDTWANLREWPALSNFETCIMTLLQEGAFLLNAEETTNAKGQTVLSKNEFAVEEFHTKGVRMLFEVLDDEPSAGGIPDGVLAFGKAVLDKIEDPKRKRNAEYTLLVKWFFGHYLKEAIVYPEHHGIMVGHHISEHARLKILRPLCSKMFKAAFGTFSVFDAKQSSPVDPASRAHVENLLARFKSPRPAEAGPLLVSTKNGAAPKEGSTVQNFVAICPADIMTLYNALYPKQPSNTVAIVKSGPLSISGSTARSFAKSPASSTFDMTSMFSRSSSSVTSETASMMPLLEKIGDMIPEDRVSMNSQLSPVPAGLLTGPQATTQTPHLDHSENFGAELKTALDSMAGKLDGDSLTWRYHPCAEDWSILFVSPDGKELSLRMKSEWADDEEDEEEGLNESDSDDDDNVEMSAMDREYHQLKQAILKLVQEYEIPEDMEGEDAAEKLRRGNSGPVVTMAGTTPPDHDDLSHLDPSNPYHTSNLTAMFSADKKKDEQLKAKQVEEPEKPKGALLTMLQAAAQQCMSRGEYVNAQQYHRAMIQLRKLTPSLARDGFSPLMHIFSRGARDAIDRAERSIKEADAWFVWLSLTQERHDSIITDSIKAMRTLRDKMWYVTDVRNSAAYEEAKNVSIALKKMGQSPTKGMPMKAASGKSGRSLAHRASHLSLLKSEGVMELLAAAPEHGGPNKLSDEQAEITSSYLQKFSVENFCKGEERIHRFCCEIDRCVNKLVGDGILDGPVLWSSELYARDERELSMPRNKGNFFMVGGMGAADEAADLSPTGWKSRELLKKSSTGNILSLASQGRSSTTGNFAAAQRSRSKSNASEFGDRDVFGMPTLSLSSSETYQTFWSPFSSAPPTIVVPARPKTSQSNIVMKPEGSNREKRKFLSELKQSLTGLLLSDLGTEVFSKGSETDQWFSGSYVEDCIQRKIEQEEEAKKQMAKLEAARRMKRKSKKNLRMNAVAKASESGRESGQESAQSCEESAASASDATSRSVRSNGTSATATTRKKTSSASELCGISFPYQSAFKSLLKKFSSHPNPFEKLHILYDLELLIISSLTSKSPQPPILSFHRKSLPPSPLLAPTDSTSRISTLNLPESSNVEQAIANIEERRSHAASKETAPRNTSTAATPPRSRSPAHHYSPPNTDKIVEVLQDLFRQHDIRPSTLFRDLQYVAAFVPASILDFTEMGKAFWDTGLAALGLKQDVKNVMVLTADEIVKYHTGQRGNSSSGKERERTETSFYERYTMEDAAKMWMITAKEGDPTAQRELAIFYLTHPTLLPRITKPLSRPKEVFRSATGGKDDLEKRDPATMCTAYHWMEASSEGGDACAKGYIKQQSW